MFFQGQLCEFCGFSTEVKVQRQVTVLFQRFQSKDENINVEVIERQQFFSFLHENVSLKD